SIAAASLGAMPKNEASNPATSSRYPPCRLTWLSAGSSGAAKPSQRPSGRVLTASTPSINICQNCSGERTPPGNRQPIPTTAMSDASCAAAVAVCVERSDRAARAEEFDREETVASATTLARESSVGASHNKVAGSEQPVSSL